eukprot:SM000057S18363  [mRNA]  locus=s57:280238:281113:+ [translate_table: standard]
MAGRALLFVGDSLGREQFQSLLCMATAAPDALAAAAPPPLDVGAAELGMAPGRGGRPPGWAFRFPATNTTIAFFWSSFLLDVSRDAATGAPRLHLDRPEPYLVAHARRFDYIVLNSGRHWNEGKLDGHVLRYKRTVLERDLALSHRLMVRTVASWLKANLDLERHTVFFRTVSLGHWVNTDMGFRGDWGRGGGCDNISEPLDEAGEREWPRLDIADTGYAAMRDVAWGTPMRVLNITALSRFRSDAHPSKYHHGRSGVQDCAHWCLPGVPDVWNEILFRFMSTPRSVNTCR